MPLLDHFNPPLSRTHPWHGFHGAWAVAMARLLNQGILPAGYYAIPLVNADGPVEIDVAAPRGTDAPSVDNDTARPRPWIPPEPGLAVAIEMPADELIEVQIFSDEGDPHLTAAVELVSPRNKDRPQARQAFAIKCASYLQQGSSLVLVDIVTTRRANLYADLFALVKAEVVASTLPPGLSAVSYRALGRDEGMLLQAWPAPLALGEPLPTLPLWIGPDVAVPLDLEASYQATCADLRIRQAV